MMELDIDNASRDERIITWKGKDIHVDRILMDPAKDWVFFIGEMEGRRKAIKCSISVSESQGVIMGDLSPLFINPL
jgi:hypothetical protein